MVVPQIQGENPAAQSVQYRGVLGTILTMVRTEGPRSPYNGLVAGLHRQMSFASIRIGLYDSVKQFYTPKGADSECPLPCGRQGSCQAQLARGSAHPARPEQRQSPA